MKIRALSSGNFGRSTSFKETYLKNSNAVRVLSILHLGTFAREFWPTHLMALFYASQLVKWPPHYEDEPWVWTPALNSVLGFGYEFPSFGYSFNMSPVFNFLGAWFLRGSPLNFWVSVRGLALMGLVITSLTASTSIKRILGFRNTSVFQAVFMCLPLADGLLYARFEVYAIAFAWVAIFMQTCKSQLMHLLSAVALAVAISIHPLTLVLYPFFFIAASDVSAKTTRSSLLRYVRPFKLACVSVFSLTLLNLNSLLSWSSYSSILRRTAGTSRLFSSEGTWNSLLVPVRSIWRFASQLAIPETFLQLGLTFEDDLGSWQLIPKSVAGVIVTLLFKGCISISRVRPGWMVASALALTIHSILVATESTYYLIVLSPVFVTLLTTGDQPSRQRRMSMLAMSCCVAKVVTIIFVPTLFSSVTPTQYALNAQSPFDYSRALNEAIPADSVVVGTIALRAVLEARPDVAVYGITALTEPNKDLGERIDDCAQVRVRLKEIYARHPGQLKLLVLYGTWQSRAFSQRSSTFDETDFNCILEDVITTRTISGTSANGIRWSWVIRVFRDS